MDEELTHEAVQQRYGRAASLALADDGAGGCCGPSSCCGDAAGSDPITRDLYDGPPDGMQGALAASLGCGNPTALVDLRPGQDVLDLGSGGGLDVLLSARRVAPDGVAYGVDLTPEMLELAERNRQQAGVLNATFLRGTIEDLPLDDAAVDVVISNCVINLSPDKDAVLAEAFRVLRAGGRFAVSDVVMLRSVPGELAGIVALWTGCISGALLVGDYVAALRRAGFVDASVEVTRRFSRDDLVELASGLGADEFPAGHDHTSLVDALDGAFASAFVRALKP